MCVCVNVCIPSPQQLKPPQKVKGNGKENLKNNLKQFGNVLVRKYKQQKETFNMINTSNYLDYEGFVCRSLLKLLNYTFFT